MCRLAVIAPVVWNIRLERLIAHLLNEDFVQYEACSVRYRNVDKEKISCFSGRFVEEILQDLFDIELLVGLHCGRALDMLLKLKNKVQIEENSCTLQSLLCDEGINDETLGVVATLPMLARVKIANQLVV